MKRSKFLGARLCTIVVASNLTTLPWAMAEPSLYVSYRSIPLRIEKHNPDLQAARLRIDEASGRNVQSGRLSNPVVGTQLSSQEGTRQPTLQFSLTQSFPLTDRLRLEKKVTRQDLEAAKVEVADVKRRLIGDARQALIRLLAVREQWSLRRDQIALAQTLAKSLRDFAAKGEVSALDAGLVQLEVMQLQTEKRQLEARLKAINGELKPLLGLPLEDPINVGDQFQSLGGMNVAEENVLKRADLEAARLRVGGAQAEADLERAKKYSDLQVSVFAGITRQEDVPIGLENESIAGVSFSLPLPFWNDNGGRIQEADAKITRRKLELQALTNKAQNEVKAASDELKEWLALVSQIDGELLQAATAQYELAEKSYREGLSDIQTVLRSREKLLQLRQTRIEALSSFYQARARYESALGY